MIMIKVSYSFGIKMVLGATFKVSISPLFHSLFPPFSLLASWNSQLLLLGLSTLNQPSPLHSWDNSIGLRYANLIPQMIMPWSQHWSSMTSEKHRPPQSKRLMVMCVCVWCVVGIIFCCESVKFLRTPELLWSISDQWDNGVAQRTDKCFVLYNSVGFLMYCTNI